ncbi:MAG TPA: hypothetical protein VNI52_00985 [Sphingobacteriaceae bacterium]|nr:hypothetical protein [Sphingobacteriaceae bacterium]
MEQNWDKKSGQGHDSDHTENQKQDQNNNGNIGREEAAGKNQVNQNPDENGQFGTTAEKGSGALDEQPEAYSDNEGLARERETGQEGYNQTENSETYGQSKRETDNNWAQGSEGSPGKGYQDDQTSGRNNPQKEHYDGNSDEQGLTDKQEGQSGNFSERNAEQKFKPNSQEENTDDKELI